MPVTTPAQITVFGLTPATSAWGTAPVASGSPAVFPQVLDVNSCLFAGEVALTTTVSGSPAVEALNVYVVNQSAGGASNVTIVSPIGQTTMSGSVAVAIASNQSTISVADGIAEGYLSSLASTVGTAGSPAEPVVNVNVVSGGGSPNVTIVSPLDGSGYVEVDLKTALPAGTNLIGQVEVSDGTNILFTSGHPGYVQGSVVVSGTVAVTQSTSPWVVSNGGTFAVQAAQSGSWTVAGTGTFNTQDAADGTTGSPVPSKTLQIGGSDGTDLRTISTDTSGRVNSNLFVGGVPLTLTNYGSPAEEALNVYVVNSSGTSSNVTIVSPVDGSGYVEVDLKTAVPAGSNLIGQVENSDGTNVIFTSGHPGYVQGTVTATPTGIYEVSPTTAANTASNPFFNAITDGTNGVVAVKAASTAATTSDPSLVVQISPNEPSALGVTGSAVPGYTVQVAGSDGTDIRTLKTTTTGQLHVVTDAASYVPALNATGQVSVTNSATSIIALNASRQAVLITNTSTTVAVFLGASGVTSSTGAYLGPGQSISIPATSAFYGITASSTATVSYMELQ